MGLFDDPDGVIVDVWCLLIEVVLWLVRVIVFCVIS